MRQWLVNTGDIEALRLFDEKVKTPQEERKEYPFGNADLGRFLTTDFKFLERIHKLSLLDDPVFIYGETGTGKELIAKSLHYPKRNSKFIGINCAALPENLLESELFGHTAGAFTGADKRREGLLVTAGAGTLFLDEICSIGEHLQSKLLRSFQEKKVRPIGSNNEQEIRCRIISASSRDPRKYLSPDLYWRICTFTVHIKPLSERKEDLQLICKRFYPTITDAQIEKIYKDLLDNPSYRGNVRQVQAYIRRLQENLE